MSNVDTAAYLRYQAILSLIIARQSKNLCCNDLCACNIVCLNYSITALTCFVMGSDP